MKSSLNKILTTAFALFLSGVPVCSLDVDHSVDEEIRKNYTPSALEQQELPPLPEFGDYKDSSTQNNTPILDTKPISTKPTTHLKTLFLRQIFQHQIKLIKIFLEAKLAKMISQQ